MSPITRKPVFGVCNQGRLKPACAAPEAMQKLEISYIETRGIVNNKGADQTARMRRLICAFVVRIWHNRFSQDAAHMINHHTPSYIAKI